MYIILISYCLNYQLSLKMIFIRFSAAAATLNRLSYSRDHPERRQRQTTFLYNNNFHNQSFTAIHGGPSHNILPNINLNIDANHKATNGIIGNTFNGNGVLFNRNISNRSLICIQFILYNNFSKIIPLVVIIISMNVRSHYV